MNGLGFAAAVIQALVWPLSALVIAWIFRRQIKSLMSERPKRLKAGPVEVEFWEQQILRVEAQVEPPPGPLPSVEPGANSSVDSQLERLAQEDPADAVLKAFERVAEALRPFLGGENPEPEKPYSRLGAKLRAAAESGRISSEVARAVEGLLGLRNLAAHASRGTRAADLTPARAAEYLAAAEAVVFAIEAKSQVGEVEMSQEEMRALQRVGTRLHRLLAVSGRFIADSLNRPVESSWLAQAREANLSDAYDLVRACIASAEDHLRTILSIVQVGPLPSNSLYTLLRTACGADVRARYLLDPGISEQERLARALNERLDNLEEQRRAFPETLQAHYDERVVHLEKRSLANGIKVLRTQKGRIVAFGEPQKTETELFTAYLPAGSLAFRFMSGFAHSKPWVQFQTSRAEATADPMVSNVWLDLNVTLFASVLNTEIDLHDEVIDLVLAAAGYPPAAWSAAKKDPPNPE